MADPAELLAIALGVVVVVQSLRLTLLRRRPGRLLTGRKRQALRAEAEAVVLLESRGYRVEASQMPVRWVISVDGSPVAVDLRVDLIVSRGRRRFVAEVKSGAAASKIATRATRRQLLEYRLASEADGVLLVDMESRRIVEVEFPLLEPRAAGAPLGVVVVGGLLGALVTWLMMR